MTLKHSAPTCVCVYWIFPGPSLPGKQRGASSCMPNDNRAYGNPELMNSGVHFIVVLHVFYAIQSQIHRSDSSSISAILCFRQVVHHA
mmetsp:Transcript_7287/g.19724  ORF Transcript_7287/g.19724 Transcript_7287/m.19724 type:complete len:88 (-) Transcript_7287:548-811(-)